MNRGSHLVLGGLALATVGCADGTITTSSFDVPTEVAVSPPDFLGEVRCSPFDGGARSYVVTLLQWDDLEDEDPFVVGSSKPAPCSVEVGFRTFVQPDRLYSAEIDVYLEPTDELAPFGGSSTGSRRVVRDGEIVVPRWQTQCGGGPSTATVPTQDRKSFIRPCDRLESDPTAVPELVLDPRDVLGEDACAVAPSVGLEVLRGALAAPTELTCDAEPVRVPAEPGETYLLYATATGADGAILGAVCTATGTAGLAVVPSCPPLTRLGTLSVDPGALTDGAGAAVCPPGAVFRLLRDGEPVSPSPLACGQPGVVGNLEPGPVSLEVEVTGGEGTPTGAAASCTATVEPGRTVDATCQAVP